MAVRDLAQQSAVDLDRGCAQGQRIATGDLVKVTTQIGYFVTRAWVTEGIRPGVLGMSHHLGRWRLNEDTGGPRVASALVRITRESGGRYVMKQVHGATPFESNDPDSGRIWWSEVGVHQNLTFPVQPDPVSGMHCWHQRVHLEKARTRRQLRRHRRRHRPRRTSSTKNGCRKRVRRPDPTISGVHCGSTVRYGQCLAPTRSLKSQPTIKLHSDTNCRTSLDLGLCVEVCRAIQAATPVLSRTTSPPTARAER